MPDSIAPDEVTAFAGHQTAPLSVGVDERSVFRRHQHIDGGRTGVVVVRVVRRRRRAVEPIHAPAKEEEAAQEEEERSRG